MYKKSKTSNKIKIIAIVGLCGSGKSVVADYLVSLGFKKIHFGGITIEEVKKRGLPVNEKNERQVREEIRKQYGMGAYAILSLPQIETLLNNGEKVLIDGLYSFSEYKILKNSFKQELLVIAIFTPKNIRYQRLAIRKTRPLTEEEAISRDISEIENIEKGGPIAIADYTLLNNGPVQDLKNKLYDILHHEC